MQTWHASGPHSVAQSEPPNSEAWYSTLLKIVQHSRRDSPRGMRYLRHSLPFLREYTHAFLHANTPSALGVTARSSQPQPCRATHAKATGHLAQSSCRRCGVANVPGGVTYLEWGEWVYRWALVSSVRAIKASYTRATAPRADPAPRLLAADVAARCPGTRPAPGTSLGQQQQHAQRPMDWHPTRHARCFSSAGAAICSVSRARVGGLARACCGAASCVCVRVFVLRVPCCCACCCCCGGGGWVGRLWVGRRACAGFAVSEQIINYGAGARQPDRHTQTHL